MNSILAAGYWAEANDEEEDDPVRKRQTIGESIIEGLKEAIAWTRGEGDDVCLRLVQVPRPGSASRLAR